MDGFTVGTIRAGVALSVLVIMALWEVLSPRRELNLGRRKRWATNLGVAGMNALIVLPAGAVSIAVLAKKYHWGLLSMIDLPAWIEGAIAVVVLDFVIYLQHVVFYFVPALWRLHRVHHADADFDVTTGGRFHPIEIVLSMALKTLAIAGLGAAPLSVLIFEVLLNATSSFNHGNVMLPEAIDRILRVVVVTPDMHRVHHSTVPKETNSNFGFNLPWWDRVLGTYRRRPEAGYEGMKIGLEEFQGDERVARLTWALSSPFLREAKSKR